MRPTGAAMLLLALFGVSLAAGQAVVQTGPTPDGASPAPGAPVDPVTDPLLMMPSPSPYIPESSPAQQFVPVEPSPMIPVPEPSPIIPEASPFVPVEPSPVVLPPSPSPKIRPSPKIPFPSPDMPSPSPDVPSPSPDMPSPSPDMPSPSPVVPSPMVFSPSPPMPSPSPMPPPSCINGPPTCRLYVSNTVCCQGDAGAPGKIVTAEAYATVTLVCTEVVILPDTSCFNVTGPIGGANVTRSTFNGDALNMAGTYLVSYPYANWTLEDNSTMPWNGTVNMTIDSTVDAFKCGLFLPNPRGCFYNGTVYNQAELPGPLLYDVVNTPGTYYNGLATAAELPLLNSLSWNMPESGCAMQTKGMLPKEFYEGSWVKYDGGMQHTCNLGEGATCTAT